MKLFALMEYGLEYGECHGITNDPELAKSWGEEDPEHCAVEFVLNDTSTLPVRGRSWQGPLTEQQARVREQNHLFVEYAGKQLVAALSENCFLNTYTLPPASGRTIRFLSNDKPKDRNARLRRR